MITREAAVRWAANAPSAAILSAALRHKLPATRIESIRPTPDQLVEEGTQPDRQQWRIWPLDGAAMVLKRYADPLAYHTEVCNLRFYNAVARAHTPRLLACDDAALALLLADTTGQSVAMTASLGGPLAARHTWERVLCAIATIHVRAERQMPLLRRLYAPQWPSVAALPVPDLLERTIDALQASRGQQPLTVSERGVLIAAGSWLHARLNVAAAHQRVPILGVLSPHSIVIGADQVTFAELTQPALGLHISDLLVTWQYPDRRDLIAHTYLAERERLGAPQDTEAFWELDATCMVAACAARLLQTTLRGHMVDAGVAALRPAITLALCEAAHAVPELRSAGALMARILAT